MSKVVVITGASSGIGHATAVEFAKQGYIVVAGARRINAMEDLRSLGIKTVELDITSIESIQNLKKLIDSEYNGEIRYLYNNAGQTCEAASFEVSDEKLERCFDVNVFGQIRTVRELIPCLIKAKGTIGFTSSVVSFVQIPFESIYSSTKAAINAYANTLAFELEPFGVKVINILAGAVNTDIGSSSLDNNTLFNLDGYDEFAQKAESFIKESNPMEPELFAKVVVNDFEHSKLGKINYYRGSGSLLLSYVNLLFPRWLVLKILIKRFSLSKVFNSIRQKYSK